MTVTEFAEMVQARPVARGRWLAKCPAHRDRSPSLAIQEGAEARVLVRCWAGCGLSSILHALHLAPRDLFTAVTLDPEAMQLLRKERAEREAKALESAALERKLATIVRRLNFAIIALGEKLARSPESDSLADAFEGALTWLRVAEGKLDSHA